MNRRLVLGGLVTLSVVRPAYAHRSKRTETEVFIEPDGAVRVTHVYHAQDAQDALYGNGLIDRPDISSLRARAKLALYTAERFSLASRNTPADLSIIGAELIGQNVYVYQTGTLPQSTGRLIVHASMLREIFPGQRNSVSINRNTEVVTVDFIGDDGPKSVA